MDLSCLFTDYLVGEKSEASIAIPGIGYFSLKVYPGFTGRDPHTGEKIKVPGKCHLSFSAVKKNGDEENEHFLNWSETNRGTGAAVLQEQVVKLGREIEEELAMQQHSLLPQFGEFVLKHLPPTTRRNRKTGEFIELAPKTAIVFKLAPQLRSALSPEADSEAENRFNALPPAPLKIPSGLSTFCLEQWPSAQRFWKLCQSLAVLSLCNNDPERYAAIAELAPGMNYAAMSNGQGDNCSIFFVGENALMKGFGHEAPMASWYSSNEPWPGTFAGLPKPLYDRLFLDYLVAENLSFCVWYLVQDMRWHKGAINRFPDTRSDDPDSSGYILEYFPFDSSVYVKYESECYSRSLDSEIVRQIYEHCPLSLEMVRKLNPECAFRLEKFAATGYPLANS